MKTVLITGCSSGYGLETARHFHAQGWNVVATMRTPREDVLPRSDRLRVLALDVTKPERIAAALEACGPIDALVNNAGIGLMGAFEVTPMATVRDVFETNTFGVMAMTQAVLPQMRERGAGTIVNITSVTGQIAAIAQQPYVASKWAFEGLSEGLAQELAPFGIRVAIIEPGVTKSAIFAKNIDTPNSTGAYDTHYRRMFQFYAAGMANSTDPFEVARVIHEAITTDTPRLRYPVSWCGPEMAALHDRIADDDWVGLGAIDDDGEYYARFAEIFDVDIAPA